MSTKPSSSSVRDQYERWVYPEPVQDLDAYFKDGQNFVIGDPSLSFHGVWPDRKRFNPTIYVPGCGSSLAPMIAYLNPGSRVVGADISVSSLRHSRKLKAQHELENLELKHLDLHDSETLGETFDFVIVTGVLHHLPDPVAGAKALKAVLAPGGVMSVMLYGYNLRAGVYMMQNAFKTLGLKQTPADVQRVRQTLEMVPPQHAVRRYVDSAPELSHDAALVDTFLHPQDCAYTVDQIYQFTEDAGYAFQSWADRGHYNPKSFLNADHPLYESILKLPEKDQASVLDNMLQMLGTHRFYMRSAEDASDYSVDFSSEDFIHWTPHLHKHLKWGSHSGQPVMVRNGLELHPNPLVPALLQYADGKRTIMECFEALKSAGAQVNDDALEAVRAVFREMYHYGHLDIELTPHS